VRNTFLLTSAATALALALPAGAQSLDNAPATASAGVDGDGTVVVTGTRIKSRDATSSSPIVTVTQTDLKSTGSASVEEYLNSLPQLVAGATKATNNSGASDASSSLNLRGLGAKRTLIMVDGRRFMPSSQDGVVDINNIPTALIERVEVVSGGASAVYGSDAMAGVVNFILKDKFKGLEISGDYGVSSRGDATEANISAVAGAASDDGRASGWLSVSYGKRNGMTARNRDWASTMWTDNGGVFAPTGSLGVPNGMLVGIDTPNGTGGFVKKNYILDANGNPRVAGPNDYYNAQQDFYITTPLERLTLYGKAKYEIAPHLRAFIEASFNNNRSAAQYSVVAPNIRDSATAPAMPADASWISPSLRAILNARPNPNAPFNLRFLAPSPFPERQKIYNRNLYRVITGLEGEIGPSWTWDASFSYSRLDATENLIGDMSRNEVVQASLADPNNPGKCRNGVPSCVPLTSLSSFTPAQIAYLQHDLHNQLTMSEKVAGVHASGDLIGLPAGALGAAFGAEYRKTTSDDQPDRFLANFDSAGFAERTPTRGAFDVWELFGELNVPILRDAPLFRSLNAELGARYSKYSNSGGVWAYKAGLNWQPVDGLRLRGIYQRAVRAPNIRELFGGLMQSFPTLTDPCSASQNPTGAVRTMCIAQGLSPAQIGVYQQPSASIEADSVANSALRPEKSDTYTLGAVFTPTFLPGAMFTVDYYNIRIDGAIDRLGGGAQGTLAGCFASNDINSPFCKTFRRSALTGEIVDFHIPLANVSRLKTAGIDFSAQYRFSVDTLGIAGEPAKFMLGLSGTWVSYNSTQANATSAAIDTAGTVGYNSKPADPKWRGVFQASYDSGPVNFLYRTRYIGKVRDARVLTAELRGAANPAAGVAAPYIDAYWYHDLNLTVRVGKSYSFDLGIRNLLDTKPPILSSPIEVNTDPSTYDPLGRYFHVGFTLRY